MTPEQFTYWLQGFVELIQRPPTPTEWKIITDHLQTVFVKVTPQYIPTVLPPSTINPPFGPAICRSDAGGGC